MLAGQLLSLAEDMIADYERFNILATLNAAVSLAEDRPRLGRKEFEERARKIKMVAQAMLDETAIRSYPLALKEVLKRSNNSHSLPDAIAMILLTGVREDSPERMISSAELKMHLDHANAFYVSMHNLINASRSFGIETYKPPEGKVPLQIRMPDLVYGRELAKLPSKLSRADAFVGVMEELATGRRTPHKILWASTTDLVISIPLDWAAVAAILLAYERLLVLAEKHLNLVKLMRELRNVGIPDDQVRETLDASTNEQLGAAIDEILATFSEDQPKGRHEELRPQLRSASMALIEDISKGMQFNCDLGVDETAALESIDEGEPAKAIERLQARRNIEEKITRYLLDLDVEEVRLLIQDETFDNGAVDLDEAGS